MTNAPVPLLSMASPTFRINGRPNRLSRQPPRHSLRCCEITKKFYSIYAYCGSNVPRRGRKGTGSTSSRWPKSNSSDQGSKARMNRSSGGAVRSLRSRRRQTRRQTRQWTKARSVRPSVLYTTRRRPSLSPQWGQPIRVMRQRASQAGQTAYLSLNWPNKISNRAMLPHAGQTASGSADLEAGNPTMRSFPGPLLAGRQECAEDQHLVDPEVGLFGRREAVAVAIADERTVVSVNKGPREVLRLGERQCRRQVGIPGATHDGFGRPGKVKISRRTGGHESPLAVGVDLTVKPDDQCTCRGCGACLLGGSEQSCQFRAPLLGTYPVVAD